MTENIKHEDSSELCEHPDMFEGKTADGVLWILSTRRATSKIFDVMHKETRYKINHSEQPTWELPRVCCAVNVNNHKYYKLQILQQDLSSIGSEISKAFSIISNDFQNCTSVIELREKSHLMQSFEEKWNVTDLLQLYNDSSVEIAQ